MDTENDPENKPSNKPKLTGVFSKAVFKSKKVNDTGEEPIKKVKRQATEEQLNHPLHGVKLAYILETLVDHYGWKYLGDRVKARCFIYNPTMKSSLAFLRKMSWAREHVQEIYIEMLEDGVNPKKEDKIKGP